MSFTAKYLTYTTYMLVIANIHRIGIGMHKGIIFFLILMSGCGTIIHGGGTQKVGITSSPAADVIINNVTYGRTPVFAKLDRDEGHIIIFKENGYQQAQATLSSSVSGWVWGNILFGGIIGLAVDAISGGMYNLEPENVSLTLTPENKTSK